MEGKDGLYWLRVSPCEHGTAAPSQYAGMYVRLTGAGSNVAIVTKEPPKFLRVHIDPDTQSQNFTSWKHPTKRWSLRLIDTEVIESLRSDPTKTNLPGWAPVEIREEPGGEQGFSFEGVAPATLTSVHCKGWMICPWAYGHPQLFYLTNAFDESKPLPDFCERVSLVQEPVHGQGEGA